MRWMSEEGSPLVSDYTNDRRCSRKSERICIEGGSIMGLFDRLFEERRNKTTSSGSYRRACGKPNTAPVSQKASGDEAISAIEPTMHEAAL